MRGGVKFYRGSAGAARAYVEADRSRADDYYLTEGTGLAQRYAAGADGRVEALAPMAGDAYEAWVGGADPGTGELRGRVRQDERALRFCEVVVNGPKSWSVAAELHDDIAVAYGAAQDRAAEAIVGWMGGHATARVGPRGAQVATPVDGVEAAVVRHYTSRAGDPHRHLHVQISARVQAAGGWRGIDTVAVRDSIGAVQGIGHATVVADPGFRRALAAHGFSLDPESGEVVQLARFVAPFSKRAEQISTQVAGYEAEWRAEHPRGAPGPSLRRAWDARAWADQRPTKGTVEPDQVAHDRWIAELDGLGYQPPVRAADLVQQPVGRIDRDEAAREVLARVGASRSAFNPADLRGEAELLLARQGVIAEPAVRQELAEDITGRAVGRMVPVPGLEQRAAGMPAHIRAWTSPETISIEADLAGRFAARAAADAVAGRDASGERVAAAAGRAGVTLDPGQTEAAGALAGENALVVVTGAAGAGKTTLLATTRAAVADQGRQLLVVTPTLKAARGARVETGARTGSAAWLAYQHGWRWDAAGRWTRLAPGQGDPQTGTTYRGPHETARLGAGDLLVVDEAGMLDQDTARALLHVADEHGARLGLVGDARQLAAVGRGGVLDLAERWTQNTCTLGVIHRFTRTVQIEPGVFADVEDTAAAALSLRMRDGATADGADPGAVFDELAGRSQVHTHQSEQALQAAVAAAAANARRAGQSIAVSVATNDQAAVLNAAARAELVSTGHVDDTVVATTGAGQRIGAGDLIVTRANDRDLDVANRDTFTVTAVGPDGSLTITPTGTGTGSGGAVGGGPGAGRVLPAGYVDRHVQLGYAGTIHAVQGETAHAGMLVLDEHTSAAGAYVGMTRGRTSNDLHLVAPDLADARAQWVVAAGRDRADLGLDPARLAAEQAADRYAPTPDPAEAVEARLAAVLDELRDGWAEQSAATGQLTWLGPQLEDARSDRARLAEAAQALAPLREQAEVAREAASRAQAVADQATAELDERARQIHDQLRAAWDADRPVAAEAARTVTEGPGRLGLITGGKANVADAGRLLDQWASKWEPLLPDLPSPAAVARYAAAHPGNDRIEEVLPAHAGRVAGIDLPDRVQAVTAGREAATAAEAAARAYTTADRQSRGILAAQGVYTGGRDLVADLDQLTTTAQARLQTAGRRITALSADPAITTQPDPAGWLAAAKRTWTIEQVAAAREARQQADREQALAARSYTPSHHRPGPERGHGISR